jgi:ABC-type transport system substrate-binding protein
MSTLRRSAVVVLTVAVLAVLFAPPIPAFERVGDKKILVFAGRQEVPTIDPSVKYDWYGSHFYQNDEVWKLVERARSIARWEERAPLYAEIQKKIAADAPEIFGVLANRRWGLRDT